MKVDSNSDYAYDGILYDLSTEEITAEDNLEQWVSNSFYKIK